ncbi:MAG TPA: hypothetical protein DEQ32_11620, partial [Gammaproteobacteria bacterium]|nr:hypothetical protein [Gammaproteobacteria bacterium]
MRKEARDAFAELAALLTDTTEPSLSLPQETMSSRYVDNVYSDLAAVDFTAILNGGTVTPQEVIELGQDMLPSKEEYLMKFSSPTTQIINQITADQGLVLPAYHLYWMIGTEMMSDPVASYDDEYNDACATFVSRWEDSSSDVAAKTDEAATRVLEYFGDISNI